MHPPNTKYDYAKDFRILRFLLLLLLPLDLWSRCLSKNEHEPIHVHVIHGARESIFDLIMMDGELADLHVREKHGAEPLTEKDKRTAEEFIRKYHKNIIDKWVKFSF